MPNSQIPYYTMHYRVKAKLFLILICLHVLLLYVPINNFSVMSGHLSVFLGYTSTQQRIKCLVQGHRAYFEYIYFNIQVFHVTYIGGYKFYFSILVVLNILCTILLSISYPINLQISSYKRDNSAYPYQLAYERPADKDLPCFQNRIFSGLVK